MKESSHPIGGMNPTFNLVSNELTILLGGKGTFTRAATIPVGDHPYGLAVGDLNGDSKADIVVANGRDNNISVLMSR
jgi:FG-GAP-like repeat